MVERGLGLALCAAAVGCLSPLPQGQIACLPDGGPCPGAMSCQPNPTLSGSYSCFSPASTGTGSTGTSGGTSTGTGSSSGQPFDAGPCASSPLTLLNLVVTSPIQLSAPTVALGQRLSASVTLCNPTSAAIALKSVDLCARPPGSTDSTGPMPDLDDGPVAPIPAGQSLVVSGGRVFTSADPLGLWYAYLTLVDGSGNYLGDSAMPDNKVTFTVVDAG